MSVNPLLDDLRERPTPSRWRLPLALALSALAHLLVLLLAVHPGEKATAPKRGERRLDVVLSRSNPAAPAAKAQAPVPSPAAEPAKPTTTPKPPTPPRPSVKPAKPKAPPAPRRRAPAKPVPEYRDNFPDMTKLDEHFAPKPKTPKPKVQPVPPPEPKPPEPPAPAAAPPEPAPPPEVKEAAPEPVEPPPAPEPVEPPPAPEPAAEPAPPAEEPPPKPSAPPAGAAPKKPGKAEKVQAFTDDFSQLSSDYEAAGAGGLGADAAGKAAANAGDGIHFGAILNINPKIYYPQNAMRRGMQGVVIVLIHITPDGRASDVDLVKSSGYEELDDQVLGAVQHWRFRAPLRGGRPVESTYKHTVIFGPNEAVVDDFSTRWREVQLQPAQR